VIGWLLRTLEDVPAGDAWLSAEERATLASMRVPKRAADFRLGRWTARCALRAWPGGSGDPGDPGDRGAWSVRPRPDGSPEPLLDGEPAPVELSLSHSGGIAMAAVGPATCRLGCDVELVEPRAEALAEQFFTDAERARIDEPAGAPADRAARVTLVWSAKESALKVLRTGLRADTRSVDVRWRGEPGNDGFAPLEARIEARTLHGAWRREGDRIVTLVVEPRDERLVALDDSPTRPIRGNAVG
jgi:4'-phosphopantetheinyl transferase